ncbi:MAG: ATP-binding protein [Bacteroidota bacterium]|nr:ATP-binding protein [Bacteroidota bacterium]
MRTVTNPFITGGYVPEEYFCDRVQESKEVIRTLSNGNNLAIISPRRMGKTGLIEHCFHQPEIRDHNYTFFIDIYATDTLKEFVYKLGKEIFDTLKPKGKQFLDGFFSMISSLRPAFKLDSATGSPTFDIGIGEIHQAAFTLEEIFKYLESADRQCVVAIDEFQQIGKYPEKNIEAILRTHIQKCKNTSFIFAGSQRHLMQNIFFSSSRPFYQSVSLLQLDAISEEEYIRFVRKHFANDKKDISAELVSKIYLLFEGHTWYVQNIFNELFSLTAENETCTFALAQEAIANKIDSYRPLYQSTLSLLPERQKEILYAIAKEGKASGVTSGPFIKKHGLLSQSSVQTAVKQLLDKEIITSEENVYQVYDRFFGLWLSNLYGTGWRW